MVKSARGRVIPREIKRAQTSTSTAATTVTLPTHITGQYFVTPWADSLDKGAGWDAADGPISNMSARGVTGNRLPNTSEIGGRSGEGRSGKSSGEFVGDEAVGKGGRKTPSRLTPDPIMKGQIKDHSRDPTGGATGGGKESGEGGEGLEGPGAGPKGPRDHQRLAGKQAALRNKAESIDAQFQVGNFHHTDLKKLVETARPLAEADALLAFEGNNEPNNWGVTYQGEQGGGAVSDFPFADRLDSPVGLILMGARWYDPYLNRWTSADSIVPDPADPQSLNRYSYSLGSPIFRPLTGIFTLFT